MRKKGKTSNIFITLVIAVAVIAICVFFRVKIRAINAENVNTNKKIEQLKLDIDGEMKRKENLEVYSKYVNTKQFVEMMARNKMGLVYPNEVIFRRDEE